MAKEADYSEWLNKAVTQGYKDGKRPLIPPSV